MMTGPLVLALSILTLAAQQAPPAVPPDAQWPVEGLVAVGTPGVSPPRLIREVKPRYPREAMSAGVHGVVVLECVVETDGSVGPVRILRSLDTVYGLDAEALRTLKEWRFAPARRDGKPVRTAVSIEMTFSLLKRDDPAVFGWPDSFATASVIPSSRPPGWSEETVRASDIEFVIPYPAGWSLRKEQTALGLVSLAADDAAGHRTMMITKPKATSMRLTGPLSAANLTAFLQGVGGMPAIQTRNMKMLKSGQVQAGDMLWLWLEMAAPVIEPPAGSPAAAEHIRTAHDGLRLWSFSTIVGGQHIVVFCTMLHAANTTDAQKEEEVRRAGQEFGAMLQRISIRAR